jgi:hypothetical protein
MRTTTNVKVICDKCGKEITYDPNWEKTQNFEDMVKQNQTWHIDLGVGGYGSVMDTLNIQFDLCDSCLAEFIDSFKNNIFEQYIATTIE